MEITHNFSFSSLKPESSLIKNKNNKPSFSFSRSPNPRCLEASVTSSQILFATSSIPSQVCHSSGLLWFYG
ncbi:unnamed protein product [Citrullus colocynthis]|uniref:Uncharacterized protein n=1 Tax=Citrullus colocynthis TaxID=252529 RepID=A0ABP0Z2M2_9ROSI